MSMTLDLISPRTTLGKMSLRSALVRAALIYFGLLSVFAHDPAQAQVDNQCDHLESPDLITGDIGDAGRGYNELVRWGTVQGITAYNFAASECNVGTCWADWIANTPRHPVIGQNMFRLKDGRFEQLGQSWLKHGFGTEDGSVCGLCLPSDGHHLGVNCSDLYVGEQFYAPGLSSKTEVNPYTGVFSYPPGGSGQSGNAIFRHLQVHNVDINPALNPGAQYFAEVQYINPHDAETGNGGNNASYRQLLVTGSNQIFNMAMTGPTVVGQPAIMAWPAIDPSVVASVGSLVDDGEIYVAAKTSYIGGGRWRYEYAIQNLNANKSPVAISVPYPPGAAVTNTGFHDVDYHSGAGQSGTDWTCTVGSSSVTWKANLHVTPEEGNPNVLRWGTLYNFRFEVNAAPGTHNLLLGTTQSRTPFDESLSMATLTPSVCDSDGVCDPGESCASCPADCASQGGGQGCCGDGQCQAGENGVACFADCGNTQASETSCTNGLDDDRDGDVDCLDADCCTSIACDAFDVDGDSHAPACDCNDAIGTAWATPGEAKNLLLFYDAATGTTMNWLPPTEPGGTQTQYDVIRSESPSDFESAATCLDRPDTSSLNAADFVYPVPGSAFYYLVRAKNACPSGLGSFGESSSGVPHVGRTCP